MDQRAVDRFRDFVTRATALRPVEAVPPAKRQSLHRASCPPLDRFREFLDRAWPIVEGEARSWARELLRIVNRIKRWRASHDLLHVAGHRYNEDAYTELMAWALAPETHLPSALARQRG